jgi:hypothetical protein
MPLKLHARLEQKMPKTKNRRVSKDDPEQSRAFIKKAREIEADEKHSAADKLMERLAKTKPEPRTSTRKPE